MCSSAKVSFFLDEFSKSEEPLNPKEVVIEATVAYKPVDLCIYVKVSRSQNMKQ